MATHNDRNPAGAPGVERTGTSAPGNVVPFARPCRKETDDHRPRRANEAVLPNVDGLLSGSLALALGDLLSRPRAQDRVCAIGVMHIAEFRLLDESLGDAVGRQLDGLIQQRVNHVLRGGDAILRVDRDVYAVLLDDLSDRAAVAAVMGRVQAATSGAYRLEGLRFSLHAKAGIALYPENTREPEELVRFARVALRHASQESAADLTFFDPSLLARLRERVWMAAELQRALDEDRLELHYQPQYALDTGEPVSAEALLRLRDQGGALLTPDRFIGIAEETGLIAPMGRWVIREACRQLAEWRAAGLPMRRVAVNVSPRQLLDEALIPTLRNAVQENGLAFSDLELELTEAMMIENLPMVSDVLQEIDALGVLLSVDDFGTGYSALAYLARLPLKRLKVDRSFVQRAVDDPRAGEIVRAVVTMARHLRLEVTAEGIETEAQRRLVAESGCELGQGFLMAKPLPPSQLLAGHASPNDRRSPE